MDTIVATFAVVFATGAAFLDDPVFAERRFLAASCSFLAAFVTTTAPLTPRAVEVDGKWGGTTTAAAVGQAGHQTDHSDSISDCMLFVIVVVA